MKSCFRHLRITLLVLLALGAGPLALSGCNTTAGIGKDLEAAGDTIEEKAEGNKGY